MLIYFPFVPDCFLRQQNKMFFINWQQQQQKHWPQHFNTSTQLVTVNEIVHWIKDIQNDEETVNIIAFLWFFLCIPWNIYSRRNIVLIVLNCYIVITSNYRLCCAFCKLLCQLKENCLNSFLFATWNLSCCIFVEIDRCNKKFRYYLDFFTILSDKFTVCLRDCVLESIVIFLFLKFVSLSEWADFIELQVNLSTWIFLKNYDSWHWKSHRNV